MAPNDRDKHRLHQQHQAFDDSLPLTSPFYQSQRVLSESLPDEGIFDFILQYEYLKLS